MDTETLIWWVGLCAVSLLNVACWAMTTALVRRQSTGFAPEVWRVMKWQMLLSAGYVLGCAYRSVFPVYDIGRQVLVDTWLSSVIVGRSVATVAELCFAAQWALLLRSVAETSGSARGVLASRAIVPLIAIAELCSWYAVLTLSNLGHVFEESLWGLSAGLLVASVAVLWPRCKPAVKPALAVTGVAGLVYVVYIFQVDVPLYWGRWIADLDQGRAHLSLAQGIVDASQRWVVSHRWTDWQSEVIWMSLYFSVAVWFSIALIHFSSRFASRRSAVLIEPYAPRSIRRVHLPVATPSHH